MDKSAPLSAERQKLLAQRLKGAGRATRELQHLPRHSAGEPAPLSVAQHQVWVADQMNPGNPAYNIPAAYRLSGRLDIDALEESFNAIVRRHEILRTTFREAEGDAIQEIHPEWKLELGLARCDHLPPVEREAAARALVAAEADKPFDLSNLLLLRASLFQLGPEDHVLLVNFHHMIGDGVSLRLLLGELDILYRAALSHTTPRLPALAIQYADFALWQKGELSKPQYAGQLNYWRQQLQGDLPLLEFAADKPRPARQSFRGSNIDFALPKNLVQALTTLATNEGCTFFVTMLAATQVILQRYSQAEEIVIGTPIANRALPEVDHSIGNFVNMVALRCDLSGNPAFLELLRRSKETAFNALSNKDIPFEMLVRDLQCHRDPSHSPIFQILLQILPASPARIGDLSASPFDFELKAAQVDLALHLYEQPDGGVLGRFQYCTDLFAAETIAGLSLNFLQLLDEIRKDPLRKILEIPIPQPPLTSDRKLDGHPLVKTANEPEPARAYVPPQNSAQGQLIDIWEEVLRRRPIGIRDDFFELGGHSLLVARLLTMVEDRLSVRLPFSAFFTDATIERMAVLMKDRQLLQAAQQSWVLLNENGTKAPFFFLHGDFNGGGFFCRILARRVGEDRPFYALHPAGLHGDPIPTTIEDMAALKLRELRSIQPEGPYLLGGYCNGALVAFEMARRIVAEGGRVPVVLMLLADGTNAHWRHLQLGAGLVSSLLFEDAVARQRRFLRWKEKFCFWRGVRNHYAKAAVDLIKQPPREQTRRIVRKTQRILRRLLGKGPASTAPATNILNCQSPQFGLSDLKTQAYSEAYFGYVPKPYGGSVVLLWPQDKQTEPPGPASGWTETCDDVHLVLVPGNHDTCVDRHANVAIIGEEMGRALAEIEAHEPAGGVNIPRP